MVVSLRDMCFRLDYGWWVGLWKAQVQRFARKACVCFLRALQRYFASSSFIVIFCGEMDFAARKSLCTLIEDATTTGATSLKHEHLSELKNLLRKGKDVVECAFDVSVKQLRREHAQVLIDSVHFF